MAATRLNTITYGGLAMGAGTSYDLHDVHVSQGDYDQLQVSWSVVVADQTKATYRALWLALEAAMRKKNADLSINLGGDTQTYSHSSNTGFNARGDFDLIEYARTSLSRTYRCTVQLELPADETGVSGRRESSWSTSESPGGLRTLTVDAVYTALGGNSATDQVDAAFATFLSGVQSTLGGTWDSAASYSVKPDKENKVATVQATYNEIIYAQSLQALNDDDFVQPQVGITTTRTSVPQLTGSGARPPVTVEVFFFTFVRKENQDLQALIRTKVIPYLRALADSFSVEPGNMTATQSTLKGDPFTNTVYGSVTFVGHASNLVSVEFTTTEILNTGTELVPVLDGSKFTKDKYEGPATLFRQLELRVVEFETKQDVLSGHAIMDRAVAASGSSWHLKQRVQGGKRTEESLPDIPDGVIKLVAITSTYLLEYGVIRTNSSGGGQTRVRGVGQGGTRVRQSPVLNDALARGDF